MVKRIRRGATRWVVNCRGQEQTTDQAIVPQGDSLPAWKLVGELAAQLGERLGFETLAQLRQALRGESLAAASAVDAQQPGANP